MMRLFNFDNLALRGDDNALLEGFWIEASKALAIDLPLYAPQPGPLFAVIEGTSGDDVITGTPDDDVIDGGSGNDVINGGAGNDTIYGGYGLDTIYGNSGDDILDGGNSDDVLHGGDGADTLNGGNHDDTLYGDDGDDTLNGQGGDDVVYGGAGNDTIDGAFGNNIIFGGSGDDVIKGNYTNDIIDGGTGVDTYIHTTINMDDLFSISQVAPGVYTVTVDSYFPHYGPTTSTYPKIIVLTNMEVIRIGGVNGTDYALSSFGQNDTNLSEFYDIYLGSEFADTVYGHEGNDYFRPNGGDDFIDGGLGQDTVEFDFADFSDFEVIRLALPGNNYTVATSAAYAGDAQFNTLHNVEILRTETYFGDFDLLAQFYTMDVHLTTANDVFMGSESADGINGREGDDDIQGLGGDDIIFAGRGRDTVHGGDGNDFIRGGESFYSAYMAGDDDDFLDGGAGDDVIKGGEGDDYIIGGLGADDLDGGRGTDTLSYEGSSAAVFVNLRLGVTRWAADGDMIANFENLVGSDYNDNLAVDVGGGLLLGGLGDDILNGSTVGSGNPNSGTAIYLEASRENISVTLVEPDLHSVTITGGTHEGTDTLNNMVGVVLGGMDGTYYSLDYLVTGEISLGYQNQIFSGYSADETINGSFYDDVFDGGTGRNFLYGNAGNDIITSLGNDVIDGGIGNDLIEMGGNVFDAATITDGGLGIDTISFSTLPQFPSGNLFFVLDLASQSYSVRDGSTVLYVDQFLNFENATGTEFRDLLQGGSDANTLRGLGGNDTLQGRDGSDYLEGGAGDDALNGGSGVDTAIFSSTDRNDYNITETASGEYTVTALNGNMDGTDNLVDVEYIQFGVETGVSFEIAALLAGQRVLRLTIDNDEFTGTADNEVINGLAGDDTINGGLGVNIIGGNAGNDTIISLGDDTITGGEGSDFIELGLNILGGVTAIDGGTDVDTVSFRDLAAVGDSMGGSSSIVTLDLAAGNYTLYADGALLSSGSITGVENALGSEFQDVITGDAQRNRIEGFGGDDVIYGGAGDDYLYGDEGDDRLYGDAGNDFIFGEEGDDYIEGGDGNDRLYGLANDDIIFGGGGDDQIYGGSHDDYLDGGDGNDYINGGIGDNTIYGGAGNDALYANSGDNVIYGGDGDDYISAGSGDDIIFGGAGVDTLRGGFGNDSVYGGAGNDSLRGGSGDDVLFGGAGYDTLDGENGIDIADYSQSSVFMFYDYTGAIGARGDVVLDTLIDIEGIRGTDFNDRLYGDDAVSIFYGGAGDDLLVGRGGDDILSGDAGADTLDGGDGIDTADYTSAASFIVFDFLGLVPMAGEIVNDTLISIEAIRGTDFNDRLFGDNDASVFFGGDGADRLFGRNGDDELYGEDGDDIILGGRDNDIVDGGAGNDQLRGNEGDDTLLGGDGNDVLTGGAGADVLDGGAGIDRVEYTYGTNAGVTASLGDASINTGDAAGDSYIDIENLYGTSFVDTLYGDASDNRIDGRLGDDSLFGGEGNDYLLGGAGNDVLNGEGGNDLLFGQAGADIYQFDGAHGTDRIVVFTQGEDLIEFTENVFDFSALTITQDGANVNIDTGEGLIIVNNSLVADFASDDFVFASPPSQEPLDLGEGDITEQDMAMFVDVDALI